MEHKATIVGIALLVASVASEALTLGNIRGVALIGQPLDMAVQVRMDEGQDLASLCFEAEVFHAETRQEASHVKVQVEATAVPDMAQVRITSSVIVDEPIVTLYLRSSCGQKTSRRYVVLADFPADSAPVVLVAPAPVPTLAPVKQAAAIAPVAAVTAVVAPAATPLAPAAQLKPREPKKKTVPVSVAKAQTEVAAPASAPKALPSSKAKEPGVSPRPQLKLEAADLKAAVKPPVLPVIEAPKALVASEETLLSLQKIQALDSELKALRASASKTQASLAELTARLQKSESESFSSAWVYSLIALLVASLAALAWFWSQQRRHQSTSGKWWSAQAPMSHEERVRATRYAPGSVPLPDAELELELEPEPVARAAAAPAAPVAMPADLADEASVLEAELAVAKAWRPLNQVLAPTDNARTRSADFGKPLEYPAAAFEPTMVVDPSAGLDFDNLTEAPAPHGAGHTVPTKVTSSPARPNVPSPEAVADIRQLAKNFVAMGQIEPALQVLQAQIEHSEQSYPELYLDLLAILHGAGDRTGFNRYRDEFNRRFPNTVAEFDLFTS